ncbi:hypothetical protein [Romboutsia ilealis]|uniref:hypothetical protein n=1 Tax=Romboutsia ilealis TaxID=1115758 RepID=UPI002494AB1F|nr:hypothetical protein [Romboutsia ilealis]
MENIIASFKKTNPTEIIDKGELVEISIIDQGITKCKTEYSRLAIGVAADKFVRKNNIVYFYQGRDINEEVQESLNVIVNGVATVKVLGHVNIGDLLISSEEPGKAKAARYQEDNSNIGRILGKVIQYTDKDDEVIAIINFS